MKKIKTILVPLMMILLSASSTFATVEFDKGKKKCFTEQIQDRLQNMDLSDINEEVNIMIKFMINYDNELVVMSTNNSQFDMRIKQRLNYLKIEDHELKSNIMYTVPLTFRGKRLSS